MSVCVCVCLCLCLCAGAFLCLIVFTVSLTSLMCVHSCWSSWTGQFRFSEVQINLHSLRSLSGSNLAAMAEAESLTANHVRARDVGLDLVFHFIGLGCTTGMYKKTIKQRQLLSVPVTRLENTVFSCVFHVFSPIWCQLCQLAAIAGGSG